MRTSITLGLAAVLAFAAVGCDGSDMGSTDQAPAVDEGNVAVKGGGGGGGFTVVYPSGYSATDFTQCNPADKKAACTDYYNVPNPNLCFAAFINGHGVALPVKIARKFIADIAGTAWPSSGVPANPAGQAFVDAAFKCAFASKMTIPAGFAKCSLGTPSMGSGYCDNHAIKATSYTNVDGTVTTSDAIAVFGGSPSDPNGPEYTGIPLAQTSWANLMAANPLWANQNLWASDSLWFSQSLWFSGSLWYNGSLWQNTSLWYNGALWSNNALWYKDALWKGDALWASSGLWAAGNLWNSSALWGSSCASWAATSLWDAGSGKGW